MQKNIICIKWGQKFGPEYVNRLYAMARRNITGDFRLICFTDDAKGLREEIDTFPLPELGCEHPKRTRGKWPKIALWGKELFGLSGTMLFVDLDSVIVDNIDGYFEFGDPNDVILARNWAKPFSRLGQTSVFRFPIGKNPHILENFRKDSQAIADKYRYEQHYVTASVTGGIKFWPGSWTRHFRLHCLPAMWPMRYFKQAKLPKHSKIVTFPGGPNPGDVQFGQWDEKGPHFSTRRAHIAAAFQSSSGVKHPIKHLKHFVLPVEWIKEHWRE